MHGWLIRSLADVPAGDAWLSARERRTAAGLHMQRRRRDWRPERFTAEAAVGAWLSVAPERVDDRRRPVAAAIAGPNARRGARVGSRRASG
jgi:hypothetical protein